MATARQRIWGWYFFDWASQPYNTLLLTFIFGPYFAEIARGYYMGAGMGDGKGMPAEMAKRHQMMEGRMEMMQMMMVLARISDCKVTVGLW